MRRAGFVFTELERRWIEYDVGNSALVLLNTAVAPIYFNSLLNGSDSDLLVVLWGAMQTFASLVVALLMPILGSFADRKDQKIKFFLGFFLTGLIGCIALALPMGAKPFLVIFVLCTIGLNSSMTFYDSMLTDVTTDERMDNVSSAGYAWGYIGSTVPFIVCLILIFVGPKTGVVNTSTACRLSFLITAIWWLFFTVPLCKSYRQIHWSDRDQTSISATLHELKITMHAIKGNRQIFIYMIAFFFYIDGVHTVISMATSYGTALGIDSAQLVLALLATQFVAFPSAIIYGRLAGRWGTLKMIKIAVIAYCGIVLFAAFLLHSAVEFWILAMLVGLFQGGIQALSRSYFGKIIPKDKSNEYYGFFDIFGRYASVMGTLIVSLMTAVTGDSSIGVLSVGILLVVGLVFLAQIPSESSLA